MRRLLTSLLCALLLLSHGGIVAAHSHDAGHSDAHAGAAVTNADEHATSDSGPGSAAVDRDGAEGDHAPAQSPFSHSHAAVDGVARLAETGTILIFATSVRHVGQSDLKPASTVIAPGLEPPTS